MKQLQIIGNIGQDAKIQSYNGKNFVSFSVAVNESYKDKNGQKVESTDWVSCTSQNSNLAPYLKSGTKVFCQGKLKVNLFKNQRGEWQAGLNLQVSTLEFLGGSKTETQNETPQPSGDQIKNDSNGEDNLPF